DIELIKSEKYIKKGASADLDTLEAKMKEIEENILTYEKALRAYTKINSLKIIKKSGECLIEIPIGSVNNLGREFLHVQTLKNSKRYTTDKLINLQDELYSYEGKSRELRVQIFENLRRYSKEMTDAVRKYSKKLALLDVFFSLYSAVIEYNLVCPAFKDSTFEIKNGKHVAAQKILGKFDPLSINFKNSDFIILTGANGAGKSTLLKEIASIIILAQAGFYVPCDSAKLALTDRLFTVLNLSDEFINKKSSHGMQMHEVSKILQNTTDKSVILLDEIGKSTSYKEGVSISYGLIRYILEETVSKTVFATHYFQLADLFKGENDRIKYLEIVDKKGKREIENGVAAKSFGILAASAENLPDKVIEYANYAMELV
ncbi:MAG: AAA family ATPase, partial [Candidatus Gastranaerophilales bacterium]|nr:AAA family ATPase [Candidatus Gastranaerophilales bacterium]